MRVPRRWQIVGGVTAVTIMVGCGGADGAARSTPALATAASAPAQAERGATAGAPTAHAADPAITAQIRAALRSTLAAGRHPWLTWPEFPYLRPPLEQIYEAEPDGLLWFEGGRPIAALSGALKALEQSTVHGLNPGDYDAATLAARAAGLRTTPPSPDDLAHFDLAVSITTARLLTSVHEGRIDPRVVGFSYDVSRKRLDVGQALTTARTRGIEAALAEATPTFPVYARLVEALARYRALAAGGEPPAVPAPAKRILPGTAWDGVPALAARLVVLGDLAADARPKDAGATYDRPLLEAVKRFQERHAIEPDGAIGVDTVKALNTPLAGRVQQIELALERERWLPDTRSERQIFVNVPLFRLWAYDPALAHEPLRMNVVVGKSMGHATPLFIEQMRYVVLSPYWSPPPSILRSEIVPHARKDAGYLARQDMEIVASGAPGAPALAATPANLDAVLRGTLFLRQKPGPKNSLGRAKFIFPNAESIYMHDTPAHQLFSRARRDFSHGCIRLEHPAALAQWVLSDQPEWTEAKIAAAMSSTSAVQVNLKTPLRVLLFYDTAYVDSHGVVHFADDYYGHDAKLAAALSRGYPYPRTP